MDEIRHPAGAKCDWRCILLIKIYFKEKEKKTRLGFYIQLIRETLFSKAVNYD